MNIGRRQVNTALATLLAGGFGAARAQSAARLLVGFPPGGSIDSTARRLAEAWRAAEEIAAIADTL